MRYVIIRDDDTNAFTPIACLERLYRPFLDAGLPVNLATIPAVSTNARMPDGRPEGFLVRRNGSPAGLAPITENAPLVRYLLENQGYHIVQHGFNHDYLEFDAESAEHLADKLERGTQLLTEAGFPRPETFVAPYDRLSRVALNEVGKRFKVLSTGWFELRRLPYAWWPQYAVKKLRGAPHWRVGRTLLLSHPGCLLSCHRTYTTMLAGIIQHLNTQQLTVLVTHWWEYFRTGEADEPFISFLHETAEYIRTHPELKVISFSDLLNGETPLGWARARSVSEPPSATRAAGSPPLRAVR